MEDWVAAIFPQTGAVRLFEDLESARVYVSRPCWFNYIFKAPWELKAWDLDDMRDLWAIIFEHSEWGRRHSMKPEHERTNVMGPFLPSDVTPPLDLTWDEMATALWGLIQRRGDRVMKVKPAGLKHKDHYDVDIEYLKGLTVDEGIYKATFNRQQRAILSEFIRRNKRYYELDEIKKMMYDLVAQRQLKTKQDAFLIFQYYRPDFITKGAMSVGTAD